MKKLLFICVLAAYSCLGLYAQSSDEGILVKMKTKIDHRLLKDSLYLVNNIRFEKRAAEYNVSFKYKYKNRTIGSTFSSTTFGFECPFDVVITQDIQSLWNKYVIENVMPSIVESSPDKDDVYQYDLRQEMEQDALQYIQMVKENGLEFNDPYLETYLYGLVAKIAPRYLLDGRPVNINILIERNPAINASCFPNGTIVVNSGLLAAMHSEDEIVAILSHEIAHFVLDHSIRNINEATKRKKRAEFWAGLATVATAVVEGVVAANSDYYIPGGATMAMAAISTLVVNDVLEQLGMNYNHKQEHEADMLAKQVLKHLGYDPNALATALSRIEQVYKDERNMAMYFNSYSHPALVTRINGAGKPQENSEVEYEQIVSFAVTDAAIMKHANRRFRQCLPLVNQNINNGVATADDYIIKANCLLALGDSVESNNEVLELLNKAKEVDATNINIYKSEIITTLRLNQKEEAILLLRDYTQRLNGLQNDLGAIQNESLWVASQQFIAKEMTWAKNMIIKINGMINSSKDKHSIPLEINSEQETMDAEVETKEDNTTAI